MPNWCSCDLFIRGPASEIKRFVKFARTETNDDVDNFDFNNFVPIPESLKDTVSGSQEMFYTAWYGSKAEVDRIRGYDWLKAKNRKDLQEKFLEENPKAKEIADNYKYNLDNHGHMTWYGWCIANWGTKWNACSPEEPEITKNKCVYSFQTAWAPPTPVVLAASLKFPELEFELKYYEGGCGYKGVFACKNGEVSQDETKEYSGSRGG